jgi:hypothetical protein
VTIYSDLGGQYLQQHFANKWFFRREHGENLVHRFTQDDSNSRFQCQALTGTFPSVAWGSTMLAPWEWLEDMEAFAYPELGYRSTPDGTSLYHFTRPLTTHRGLNETLLQTQRAAGTGQLRGEQKAWLVYNPVYVTLAAAVAALKENSRANGWAISNDFAITRNRGAKAYTLLFRGNAVGTVSPDGVVTVVQTAVKRLFDKVA